MLIMTSSFMRPRTGVVLDELYLESQRTLEWVRVIVIYINIKVPVLFH
jgi:hypothetical protein